MPTFPTNWTDAVPAGADLLSQGDDAIRALEAALHLRIESFFQSIDQDPWTPIDGIIKGPAIAGGSITIDKLDPALNIKTILMQTALLSATIATFKSHTFTVTVTGAESGDFVFANWLDGALVAGPVHFDAAYVSAADTVTLVVRNMNPLGYVGPDPGGGPITITSLPDTSSDPSPITLTNKPVGVMVVKVGTPGQLHSASSPIIPSGNFNPKDDTQAIGYSVTEVFPGYIGPLTVYGSLALPTGTKVVGANLRCNSVGTGAITGTLWQVNSVGGTTSLCTFAATPGGGLQTLNQVFNYVVNAGDMLVFEILLDSTTSANANDARLDWAQVLTG